ncbi:MAG: type I-G CRISPR-associated protein Cas8g1/Csx17 [Pseudomonadota bacterium]
MNEIVLHGCTPTPLASYLKALAVLRLVAEQAGDPEVAGYWRGDVFVLRTRLNWDELLQFFLERYEPTPLVAPWNGGSGFYPKDSKEGIELIATTDNPRYSHYRRTIEICSSTLVGFGLAESPKGKDKQRLLETLRNRMGEDVLCWMDAAVILSDNDPRYPPLLGTGGNDGRLDFTNNFMQRLGEVFDIATGKPAPDGAELLQAALAGSPTSALIGRAIGQFAPGNAGGPNASSGFEGDARINPWDFILMLEGAVLFAASAVRRLESSNAALLSAPFTVRSRAGTVGNAAAGDDADARGEIWMPLWAKPFTLTELGALFSEGRAALGVRPVQDGLEFARAVAKLGVDRGITDFQRYGFLMRSGKAFLATPLTRVPVRRNPQADLIDDLDRTDWLSRVQRLGRDHNAPNAFRASASQLDTALFAMARRVDRHVVEQALRLLGRTEVVAARSPRVREQVPPLPMLTPSWVRHTDDGSAESRIATALAGLSLRSVVDGKRVELGLRPHLVPVRLDGRDWDKNSHLACWGAGSLERNLAQLLHRRHIEAIRLGVEGDLLACRTGATLEDVSRFLEGGTDDLRIAELAHGLACVERFELDPPKSDSPIALPPAYALLKPFFTAESMLRALDWLPRDRSLCLAAEIPARLAADDVQGALRLAWQRLRALGISLPGREPPCYPRRGDGQRLLAALVIPLTFGETRRLLNRLDLKPETELEPTTETAA